MKDKQRDASITGVNIAKLPWLIGTAWAVL